MLATAWILLLVALIAAVACVTGSMARDRRVEGFEDDALRALVIDEFHIQKGSPPSLAQLSGALDALAEAGAAPDDAAAVTARVAAVLEATEAADPSVAAAIDEFKAQTGEKPSLAQLNAVVDALAAGVEDAQTLPDLVARVLAGEIALSDKPGTERAPPAESPATHKQVIAAFVARGGEKPSPEEFGVVLDALASGGLQLSGLGDFVQKVIDREVEVPDPPAPPAKQRPPDFELNVAVINAFLEHAGRRPTQEELSATKAAVSDVAGVAQFVQDTVAAADPVRRSVRAATEMAPREASDADVDAIAKDVASGRRSLLDVVGEFAGASATSASMDNLPAGLEDDKFVEAAYREVFGAEVDPDTAVFLLAKLREWGDRQRVFNIIVTLHVADLSEGAGPTRASVLAGSDPESLRRAAEDWNFARVTRRPESRDSPAARLTSVEKAFNATISDVDRLVLAAYRHPTVPSHDVLHEGDDMVLRDDLRWEYPGTKMPCPDQSCGDPADVYAQSSLVGTFLAQAERTGVGSLMPAFEFRELAPRGTA